MSEDHRRSCRLLGKVLAAFAMLWCAQAAAFDDAEVQALLRQRIDVEKRGVGMVVGLIDENGRRLVSHGVTRLKDGHPVDGATMFEIGSITKVFTSITLADMAERGELAVGDPVAKLLPEQVSVPRRGNKQITLLNLSQHTSGLPRLPDNFAPASMENPYADYTEKDLYSFLAEHRLKREIGAQVEYSNLGAGLLGHALAQRAGTDYATLVRQRVMQPLQLQDTVFTLSTAQQARLASGHLESREPAANWDFQVLAGAGGLRSSANDMLRFMAANLNLDETPLKPALQRAQSRQQLLAWQVARLPNAELLWHNGGTGGYASFMGLDGKNGRGVFILSNTASGVDDLAIQILLGAAKAPVKPPSAP
ncbi:serine hydrolase [Massilia sp. erpn]|uniref:serine hydrolase domain-containing protein n=1 Tax=Massilia sp. erpn TaxID=2738142 RepID=UPI002106F0B3|nr:serine hydrolase domain-containing protein [Massilia sp. erpn]UTY59771.1 beta-lactamase family protein [Massilia sp. erpn]